MATTIKFSDLAAVTSLTTGRDYWVGVRLGTGVGATNRNIRYEAARTVHSFQARIGDITAQGGDYTASQITDSLNKVIMTIGERNKLTSIASGAVSAGNSGDSHALLTSGVNPHQTTVSQVIETTNFKHFTLTLRTKLNLQASSAGTTGELSAGTVTTFRLWTPKVLADHFQTLTGGGGTGAITQNVYLMPFVSGPASITDALISTGSVTVAGVVPGGGANGYVLKKSSTGDYDYSWQVDQTGSASGGYDTIQVGGTAVTGQSIFNFSSFFTASNNAGQSRTDINLIGKLKSLGGVATTSPGFFVHYGVSGSVKRSITVDTGLLVSGGTGTGQNPKIIPNFGTTTNTIARGSHTHGISQITGLLHKQRIVNLSWSGKPAAGSTRTLFNNTTGTITFGTGPAALNLKSGATALASGATTIRVRTSSNNGANWTNRGLLRFASGARTCSTASGFTTGLTWPSSYMLQFKAATTQDGTLAGVTISIRGTQA